MPIMVGNPVEQLSSLRIGTRRWLRRGWAQFCGLLGVACLFFSGPALAIEEVPADILHKLAGRLEDWAKHTTDFSYTLSMRIEELDKGGKVEHFTELVQRKTSQNGKETTKLLSANRDGKDILEERKGAWERSVDSKKQQESDKKPDKKNGLSFNFTSPFSSTEQSKYRFVVLGPDKDDAQKLWIAYAPRGKSSPQLLVGQALIEPSSGALVRERQHPSENPSHVDRMEIKTEYAASTPYGNTLSLIEVKGEGGFLFIRKRIRTTLSFSDYQFGDKSVSPENRP